MIKILIADDHTMFADGIASILAGEKDLEVVGQTPSGAGIFEIIEKQEVHLILLDVNLLDMSGIEVCKILNSAKPDIKILAISMFNEESIISEILNHGALGYILKNTDKEELLNAIRTVHGGQTFFSKAVTETIMRGLLKNQPTQYSKMVELPKISRREKEVLELIAQEYTTQEIADKLFINLKTVESHRSSLLAKFNARNAVGLVRIAIEKGVIR